MKSTTRNASSMKRGNMLEIIDIVRQGPISRAELARSTGLTRAAVTIIVDRLEAEGCLVERGAGESVQGKKPILLDIGDDSFRFMGVDITRVNCTLGIVDIKGRVLDKTGFDLSADAPFESILPEIVEGMRSLYNKLDNPDKFQGVGVSVPGPVDFRSGTVLNPPNFNMLQGQNVLERLKGSLDCGFWLDNNAAARTLHEKNLGDGRRFRNFIVMIVDTGVGSGLVLDGKLFRGMGFAGEVGHASIDRNGDPCTCGNSGCLEGYAAIPQLLRRECAGRPDIASWKDLVDKGESGDIHCLGVIEKEAQYLAQGIVNTANLLDLEAVILTGYIAYRPEMLLARIRRAVQGDRITGGIHGLEIVSSAAKEDAGALSAAMIAMEKFLSGETGWYR